MKIRVLLVAVICLLLGACGPQEDNVAEDTTGSERQFGSAPPGSPVVVTAATPVVAAIPSSVSYGGGTPTRDLDGCPESIVYEDGKVVTPSCGEDIPYDPSLDEGHEGTGEMVNQLVPTGTPDVRPPCKLKEHPTLAHSGLEGCVVDRRGGPVAEALIAPLPKTPGVPIAGAAILTDAKGNYAYGLPPGPYTITVTGHGYRPATKRITVTDKSMVLDFVLQPVGK